MEVKCPALEQTFFFFFFCLLVFFNAKHRGKKQLTVQLLTLLMGQLPTSLTG